MDLILSNLNLVEAGTLRDALQEKMDREGSMTTLWMTPILNTINQQINQEQAAMLESYQRKQG